MVGKLRAVRQGDPPLAGLGPPPGDIHNAIVIEVADLHIDPRGGRVPTSPEVVGKLRAIRQGNPPLTSRSGSPGDVNLAISVEVTDFHIDPIDGRGPGGPELVN